MFWFCELQQVLDFKGGRRRFLDCDVDDDDDDDVIVGALFVVPSC